MANRRMEPTSYRPFRGEPNLTEGLLAVPRDGGDLERKVAVGMARMAEQFGQTADRQAQTAGARDGARAAMQNAPTGATTTGGDVIGSVTASGTATAGIRVAPRAGNDAAAYSRDYLIKKHSFSPVAAAAVAGHGMQESGFANDVITGSRTGDNGTAFGVFQWRGDRLTNLKRFAQSSGTDWRNLDTQLDFTVHELNTSETLAGKTLGGAVTIEDAVSAFMHFERPQGYTSSNPQGGHAYSNRLAFAKGLAGAGAGTSAANAPSSSADKRGGGFSQLPSAASVAPMSVTPLREPVVVKPGKAGSFRPTGSDTIYGRAYDVQGSRTYLEMADAAMVENQQALFDAYGDDPAMLEKALGEGLTADLQENVFEEIEPEYRIAYSKRASALLSKSKAAQKERQMQTNRADFLTRTGEMETRRAQLLAGLDANDPSSAGALADAQASIDAHYDSAVARGVIDADDAVAYKQRSRSETTVGFYVSQTRGLSADKIEIMQAEMREHFAKGGLDGVSGDDWQQIEKGLSAAASMRRTQDETATSALKQRGNEIVNKIARGQPIDADEMSRFQMDIGTATNGRQIASSTFARIRVADALRKSPISDVEKNLESLLKGDGDTVNPEDVTFARTTIAEFRQAITVDPLGKAEAIGLIPPVASIPVDGTATPDQIAAAVSYRRGAADAVAKHFGVAPRYFRPGEADAVMRAAEQNPEALVVFTQSVRDAFGSDAGRALSEFSESGPSLAHAAGLSLSTGDVSVARDVASALSMKQQKQLPDLTPEIGRRLMNYGSAAVSGAFIADPRTQNAALQTAQLLFQQDAARLGLDPADIKTDGSPAQTAYLKALDRSLGGRTVNGEQFGGIDDVNDFKIVTPSDMKKGEPQNLLEDLTEEQLAKLPKIRSETGYAVSSSQLRGAYLISDGDGIYRVALGDPLGDEPRYLAAEDGGYWRLDIRALKRIAGEPLPPSPASDFPDFPLFNPL